MNWRFLVAPGKTNYAYSYLLLILGILSVLIGFQYFALPQSSGFPAYLNVYPTPPTVAETCYGVYVAFPYPWSCPPDYARLPSPLDVAPLVSITYFILGGLTLLSTLPLRFRHQLLALSLSGGLYLTNLTTSYAFDIPAFYFTRGPAWHGIEIDPWNRGWPLNWLGHSISSPLCASSIPRSACLITPSIVVFPGFLGDLALYSLATGLAFMLIRRVLRHQARLPADKRPFNRLPRNIRRIDRPWD